jgi:hypothetical protein
MTTHQNLWDMKKSVLSGTFGAINSYATKIERSQINNQKVHLENQEKTKSKISRRKETFKYQSRNK